MNWKKHVLEGLTLIVAAVICATVSNAIAARERKMVVVGTYPNALKVPQAQPDATAAPVLRGAPVSSPAAPVLPSVPVPTKTAGEDTGAPRRTTKKPAPPSPPPDVSKFTQHPDKPYIEIAFNDVKALHDSGALFLDARRTSVYEQGHISGARPY